MSEDLTKKAVNTPASELSAEQREIIQLELEAKRMEVQLKKQQLDEQAQRMEGLKLEQEERRYHIKDLKSSIAERELTEKQKQDDRLQQGLTMRQDEEQDKFRWKNCTHGKGGTVSTRNLSVLRTGGDSDKKAIIKHQMINGDIWVLCLRCAKTWKPPVKKDFYLDAKGIVVDPKDGVFDAEKFQQARFEYLTACNMNTSNSMSTSVQCRFTRNKQEAAGEVAYDATEEYRQLVGSSTLR